MKKLGFSFLFVISFLSTVYATSKVIKSDPKPATVVHKEFVLDPLDCEAVYKVADDGDSATCSVQLEIDQTADAVRSGVSKMAGEGIEYSLQPRKDGYILTVKRQIKDADLSWEKRGSLISWFFASILNNKAEATVYTPVKKRE